IRLDTARVEIDRFHVATREQELLLDGVASRRAEDSLTLTLRNFDLPHFSQFADRIGYAVEGRTNGQATMRSVLRDGVLTADIAVDSLAVNGIAGPPLRLTSGWDFARNRAGVTVTNRQKRDTLVRGFYAPARQRYYARLAVDSLDMGLLDPLLSGVIGSTRGLASAELTLQGRGREADLAGRIRVRDLSTRVEFTQVRYTLPEAELAVAGNRFRATGATIYDPEGNSGRLDLDLDLKHLSNIGYELRVEPREMQVLNTTSADNDIFYGRVYATGVARIRGDKGAVRMDVSASTEGNSSFYMPLSGKSNISYADFVRFVEPPAREQDIVARKKLSFERRQRIKSGGGSQMEIALALDVRPNVEVELTVSGNTLKARGSGTLNLAINPRTNLFEMYGDYILSEGSFQLSLQNIINKRFVIEDGSTIQWTGSPMDALLNIEAVYKLKASLQPLLQGTSDRLAADRSVPVECVIRLGDRLTNPAIAFDVRVPGSDPETQAVVANALATPETVDTQFAYLLMFNSFMAENGAGPNLGASVSASTGLELVSNMVSNMLSRSDYGIVLRYRPKSELTSDEVDFGLSKSLIDNRLFVEVEGNYLLDNRQAVNSSMSNFMGEAYVTYLIDRSGTLRLKAFTQTIDRFDENQGLQETGVGIYFKQDFNNFRDFRRRIKERFTNKKRQERRAARRAARAASRAAEQGGAEPDAPEQAPEGRAAD
ncbi:MAG: translocation/assembly module TamB domain-containing protein, partial [Alistipes sp.]|nr:translocation/assembly module TamB domain-containing protein [Alistipes sp.]